MKNKLKSSAFWLSITAGVIVVLNSIGKVFNFNVNEVAITSIATSVIGLLVVIGVLTKSSKNEQQTIEQQKQEFLEQTDEMQEEINKKVEKQTQNINEEITDEKQ